MTVIDQSLDYAQQAKLLEELYNQLNELLYEYEYGDMDEDIANMLAKLISDWQDWYYGNWDNWGDSTIWQERYEKGKKLLDAEIAAGAKQVDYETIKEPPIATVVDPEPIYIYGQVPDPVDMEIDLLDYDYPEYEVVEYSYGRPNLIPWLFLIGGSILIYNSTKRKERNG